MPPASRRLPTTSITCFPRVAKRFLIRRICTTIINQGSAGASVSDPSTHSVRYATWICDGLTSSPNTGMKREYSSMIIQSIVKLSYLQHAHGHTVECEDSA